ncbi:AI-2E family transporter [uncultured Limosilactobacillus sp.]|uniref:AI-2E family transporter n=1 Tax=uncultured Limosilactobacillus sp. TaxID=2837629 RepID=UPI0025EB8E58|nr:AI-2E family transporter [uncultured Limosilactobacillus sp.]
MKKTLAEKRYLAIFITLFALYLAITYWPNIAKFIGNIGHATVPLLAGAVLAYIINILLNQWERLYTKLLPSQNAQKFKRGVCITLSYISIIVILAAVLWLVIPEVIACIKLLLAHHSRLIQRTITYLSNHSFQYLDPRKINWSTFFKQASVGVGGTLKIVRHTASRIISFGTTTVIALFFSVYLLIFKEMLRRQFNKLMDLWLPRAKEQVMYVIRVFDTSFSSYISGQCKDAVILGICCFIGMTILRLPYAYMMGAVTTVTALIPIIGAILGASVGVVIIFAVSPVKALIFLIFIVILQQLDNRITYPIVVGKAIDLPSVWVFVAVMVGGGVSGIIGMMFTVPLFSAFYRLIRDQADRRAQ